MGLAIRPFALSIAVAVALALWASTSVDARLYVAGPEDALRMANVILTGTVVERNYADDRREVSVKVKEVLKGHVDAETIRLYRPRPIMYGWQGFDFPEVGTDVFLVLSGSEGYYGLPFDLNCVAVVEDGHVADLYRGSSIGAEGKRLSPADYVAAYDAFYQGNKKSAKSQAGDGSNSGLGAGLASVRRDILSFLQGLVTRLANR